MTKKNQNQNPNMPEIEAVPTEPFDVEMFMVSPEEMKTTRTVKEVSLSPVEVGIIEAIKEKLFGETDNIVLVMNEQIDFFIKRKNNIHIRNEYYLHARKIRGKDWIRFKIYVPDTE